MIWFANWFEFIYSNITGRNHWLLLHKCFFLSIYYYWIFRSHLLHPSFASLPSLCINQWKILNGLFKCKLETWHLFIIVQISNFIYILSGFCPCWHLREIYFFLHFIDWIVNIDLLSVSTIYKSTLSVFQDFVVHFILHVFFSGPSLQKTGQKKQWK